jgi:hypothetical protein
MQSLVLSAMRSANEKLVAECKAHRSVYIANTAGSNNQESSPLKGSEDAKYKVRGQIRS